jgi:hypothetical protein
LIDSELQLPSKPAAMRASGPVITPPALHQADDHRRKAGAGAAVQCEPQHFARGLWPYRPVWGDIRLCQEHYSGQVAARVDARLAQTFVELADTFGPRLRL